MVEREKQRVEREEIRERSEKYFYIICICILYYFNV